MQDSWKRSKGLERAWKPMEDRLEGVLTRSTPGVVGGLNYVKLYGINQIIPNYNQFAFVYLFIHCFVGPAGPGT